MRFRDVGLSLVGSAVVYVSVAACNGGGAGPIGTRPGGAGGHGPVASSGGGRGGNGSSDGTSGTSGGTDSGLLDAIANPIPDAAADPTNGSRLKATYRLGEDGSKEYVPGVWFDSTRNEDCAFTLAADGKQRCLPAGAAGGAFSDSSCTMPVVAVPTGCATPSYAVSVDTTTTCGPTSGGTHIYALGAAASPQNLYVASGNQCFAAGPAGSTYTYYSQGAEIPPSSFVAATPGHD